MKHTHSLSLAPALVLSLLGLPTLAQAQVAAVPSALNFQGRVATLSGNPVPDGTYSVRFSLWDAVSAGTEKWNKTLANVQVKNGTFAVTLDTFPANTFNGNLWLEVKFGTDAALAPRTPLVSVPYALKSDLALSVPDDSITTAKLASSAASLAKVSGGTLTSVSGKIGIGTSTPGFPLSFVSSLGDKISLWGDLGNSFGLGIQAGVLQLYANTSGSDIAFGYGQSASMTETMRIKGTGNVGIGTSDPQAKLHINGGVRVEGNAVLELGGGITKQTDAGKIGYQIYSDSLDIIGAGTAGNTRKIKFWNEGGATFTGSVLVPAFQMPTGAGAGKVLTADANGNGTWGQLTASQIQSVDWSQITNIPGGLGGVSNSVSGLYTVIAGGSLNNASGGTATIAGGVLNIASGAYAIVGGGNSNTANNTYSTVGGGNSNLASGQYAIIGGGNFNIASGLAAIIAGGGQNTATNDYATVIGGINNKAEGLRSTVAGGSTNKATGENSFAAGRNAQALHNGSFVWGDMAGGLFDSSAANQFNIRATGGTRIYSNSTATTGVVLNAGAGSWSNASDRNLKTNFRTVDTLDVLEKLTAMPMTTWNYKANTNIRHIGVMAQDFWAAFGGLGMDDKHIDTVDADGVAFAAIQGLNRKLEAQNAELKKKNTELEARLERLEAILQRTQK